MASYESSQIEPALEALLEKIIKEMEKKGALQGLNIDRKALIQVVSEAIKESGMDLTNKNLNDPALQKTLVIAVTAALMQQLNPSFKMNLTLLFKDKDFVDKNELKLEMKKFLTALNQLEKDPEKRAQNEKIIDQLAENVTDKLLEYSRSRNTKSIAEDTEATNVLDKLFTESLRAMFDGIDPRVPSQERFPVQRVVGNWMGLVDMGPEVSKFAVIDQNSVTEGPDYTGSKELALEKMIGTIGLVDYLVDEFRQAGLVYDSPTNKPHQQQS